MRTFNQQFVEKELSKRSGRNILLKEGYYSALEEAFYQKIFVIQFIAFYNRLIYLNSLK